MRQSLILLINFLNAEHAETMYARPKPKFGGVFARTVSENCIGLAEVILFKLFKAGLIFLGFNGVAFCSKVLGAEFG